MTPTQIRDRLKAAYDPFVAKPLRHKVTAAMGKHAGKAISADQVAITIPNEVMDAALDILEEREGEDWSYLRALRDETGMCISREYPGAWVRAAFETITKTTVEATPSKKGE